MGSFLTGIEANKKDGHYNGGHNAN